MPNPKYDFSHKNAYLCIRELCIAIVTFLLFNVCVNCMDMRLDSSQPYDKRDVKQSRPMGEGKVCDDALRLDSKKTETLRKNSYSTKFPNDTNANITVIWTFNDDRLLLVVTTSLTGRPSTLYRSLDYGKNFDNMTAELNGLSLEEIHQSQVDRAIVIMVSRKNKNQSVFVITEDAGLTFHHIDVSFRLTAAINFHPEEASYLLAKSSESHAWLSTDKGRTWKNLGHKNIHFVYWSPANSSISLYLLKDIVPSSKLEFDLIKSVDLGKNFKTVSTRVKSLEMKGKFMYTAVYSNRFKEKTILRVSTNEGLSWNEVQLPVMRDDQFFRVLDMSEGMVFIHVDQPGDTGHGTLFTSDADGIVFAESLKRHLFPNHEKISDFYKVNSLRGVYLTSQLNSDRTVHTMVTFNRGGTWRAVKKPKMATCSGGGQDCYLQVSYQFSAQKGVAVPAGPLSTNTAIGIVLAHGHVGHTLMIDPPDVFVTADGGYNWTKVLRGPHIYAIADHGGLLLAVPSGSPTNTLKFSVNEGTTWFCYQFANETVQVTGLLTDPDHWSLRVGVWGYVREEHLWKVTIVDFKSLLERQCDYPNDFEDFVSHEGLNSNNETHKACLLGLRLTYKKLTPTAWCYLGPTHEPQKSSEYCPCTMDDYECDFGYSKTSSDNKCTENPLFKGSELAICVDGQEREIITSGYRKIPGDVCVYGYDPGLNSQVNVMQTCQEGDKIIFDHLNSFKSHNFLANISLCMLVIVVITTMMAMAVFFFKKLSQINQNSSLAYRYKRLTTEVENDFDMDSSDGSSVEYRPRPSTSTTVEDLSDGPATLLIDTSDNMSPIKPARMTQQAPVDLFESDEELLQ